MSAVRSFRLSTVVSCFLLLVTVSSTFPACAFCCPLFRSWLRCVSLSDGCCWCVRLFRCWWGCFSFVDVVERFQALHEESFFWVMPHVAHASGAAWRRRATAGRDVAPHCSTGTDQKSSFSDTETVPALTMAGNAGGSLGGATYRRYHSAGRGQHRRAGEILEEIFDVIQPVPLERLPSCACCSSSGLPKSF